MSRVEFVIEKDLPASAAAAWPFLTDPERMNRWSEARIAMVAPGDGGDPGGVGALREVAIRLALGWGPARRLAFDEVIDESEPPVRLVYRIVRGVPLRRHRGVVTLRDTGAGRARLRWRVEAELPVPGLGAVVEPALVRALDASLDALAREVRGAPERAVPPPRRIDETDDLPELFEAAEATLARERALANALFEASDPKRWFARVYEYVTEAQIARCREGAFAHPGWVLRLIPRFHAYFEGNLRRYRGEDPGRPETHWRSSFRAMDEAERWQGDEVRGAFYGIAKGMQAHIEEDLPRTLAEVYLKHYAERCDYARFRADYLRMDVIFGGASERLLAHIPRAKLPWRSRVLGAVLPREALDWLAARDFYDLPRERRRAFERGERLVHFVRGLR